MGKSSSCEEIVNNNTATFTINIVNFKPDEPDYNDLKIGFRSNFSLEIWNQLISTLRGSITSYTQNVDNMSWKTTYNTLYSIYMFFLIFSFLPSLLVILSIIILIFLLFISLLLTVISYSTMYYIWISIWNYLNIESKIILFSCYAIVLLCSTILYLMKRSIKPLKICYLKQINKNLQYSCEILNKIYLNNIIFKLESIKYKKKAIFDRGIKLNIQIQIILLNQNIKYIKQDILDDALNNRGRVVESSQSSIIYLNNKPNGYFPVEGNADAYDDDDNATDIDINIHHV